MVIQALHTFLASSCVYKKSLEVSDLGRVVMRQLWSLRSIMLKD